MEQTTLNKEDAEDIISRLKSIESKLDMVLQSKTERRTAKTKLELAEERIKSLERPILCSNAFKLFYPSITESKSRARELVRLLVKDKKFIFKGNYLHLPSMGDNVFTSETNHIPTK